MVNEAVAVAVAQERDGIQHQKLMREALVHGIDLEKHAGKPEHRCDERFDEV